MGESNEKMTHMGESDEKMQVSAKKKTYKEPNRNFRTKKSK